MPLATCYLLAFVLGYVDQPGLTSKLSATDVVRTALAARGGAEALRAVVTVKRSGQMTLSGSQASVVTWSKRPNRFRREIELPGLRVTVGSDGASAWSANGANAPGMLLSGPSAERVEEEAAFETALLDYAAKGHKLELLGTEPHGARSLHHLKLLKKNGKTEHFYIDAETGLEMRLVFSTEHGGVSIELAREFSDYREVKGIRIPFVIREFANGVLVTETTLDTVEINERMEDTLFRAPS